MQRRASGGRRPSGRRRTAGDHSSNRRARHSPAARQVDGDGDGTAADGKIMRLQGAIGNAGVARLLADDAGLPAPRAEITALPTSASDVQLLRVPPPAPGRRATIRRAPHLPQVGMQIRYQGQVWNVIAAGQQNPQITIRRNNNTQHLQWQDADYTILRDDTDQDHDLRENDPGAQGGPVDAYAGLTNREREDKIREKFDDARNRALEMIKAEALRSINAQSRNSLNALTLRDFVVTKQGLTLIGAGKPNEPAEWECTWTEGTEDHPRRTWTFIIDADNPLPTSSQDPHVGWTTSAAAGSQPQVGNTFGHVWVDHVPVMRI